MKIGGLQKTSLLDYPGEISAIIWTIGCNLRCPFCYNVDVVKQTVTPLSENDVLSYLEKRRNVIDALVISGGEPLLQEDIVSFCEKVKGLGYLIKIDTNGTFPEKLKELVDKDLVDYIAMDVKAPKNKYNMLAGTKVDIKKIQKSIDIIRNSGVDYEFKTTFVPGLLVKEDIVQIGMWLDGSEKFFLQQFKNNTATISSDLENVTSYSKDDLLDALEEVKHFFKQCSVRGI
ncbi:MAG: anaerobic ribonucleoside-triphosphate reductase activating protein [Thermoplasmatota archaeon]